MAESQPPWWLTILVGPLIVGILVALVTFVIPKWLSLGKQLSYSIDGPITLLDKLALSASGTTITLMVNGVTVPELFAYKVRLWNSGDSPLKDLPVRLVFDTPEQGFQILEVKHETTPKHEFGKIVEQGSDATSKRFVFELLNPDDEDSITLMTNKSPHLQVYAKAEGLQLALVETTKKSPFDEGFTTVVAIASAFAGMSLQILWVKLYERFLS
jgi:hypothetical protein